MKATVLPHGFAIRFEGKERAIAFDEALWKVMDEILPTTRAKLEATMRAYCELGPQNLPPQRFKFEWQHVASGKKTRMEAFKADQVRFYGACGSLGGRPVFLVTGCDKAKKSNSADQKKLKAAGKRAHAIFHPIEQTKRSKSNRKRK